MCCAVIRDVLCCDKRGDRSKDITRGSIASHRSFVKGVTNNITVCGIAACIPQNELIIKA
jgi:hypothetical protein